MGEIIALGTVYTMTIGATVMILISTYGFIVAKEPTA